MNEIKNVDVENAVSTILSNLDPTSIKIWGGAVIMTGAATIVGIVVASDHEISISKGDFNFSLKKLQNVSEDK